MTLRRKITLTLVGGLIAACVLLWALMDDQRGHAWAVSFVRSRFPEIPQLTPADLQAWQRDASRPAPLLIDVRSPEEFALSHLREATALDVETATPTQIKALDPARPYVIYCSAGYRSCQMAQRLREAGFSNVHNLEGGIFAWANEGRPVHRGAETVSEVHPYHALFSRLLKPELRPH